MALTKEKMDYLKKQKFLIVEDDPDLLSIMKETFNKIGIQYYAASNGLEGIEIIDNTYVNCIITDLNMPLLSGLTLSEYILDKYNKPIIMISARGDEALIETADRIGIAYFLVKPMDFVMLFEMLCKIDYDNYTGKNKDLPN